jgi:nucleoside-diphosphate-sugar epimerase
MRLMTERVLGEYFDLSVARAGGIYGPGRNIVTRVLAGKPLASRGGGRKVGRIHVDDLAGVIRSLALRDEPLVVNAVDDEAATSLDLLRWLRESGLGVDEAIAECEAIALRVERDGAAGGDRLISNARLRDELGYALRYPTFREGLAAGL